MTEGGDAGRDGAEDPDGRDATPGPTDGTDTDTAEAEEAPPVPDPRGGPVAAWRWFWRSENEWVAFGRDIVRSAAGVALVGLVLYLVSGVWPPMVAVESGSMRPHMYRGDLVVILEAHRFADPAAVQGTGIVPYQVAAETGYWKFGDYGDVLVFADPMRGGSPVIHRARFWVGADVNWVAMANTAHLPDVTCGDVPTCPTEHAGFITKGDNNPYYDQAQGIARTVKPEWIRGRAVLRVPWLGHVRLFFSQVGTGSLDALSGLSTLRAAAVGGALTVVGATRA